MKQCVVMAMVLALLAAPGTAAVDEGPGSPADAVARAEADRAVARSLAYLAAQQQADGSFDLSEGGGSRPAVAAALLAFVASGNTPGLGRYRSTLANAADFLAKSPLAAGPTDQAMIVLALSQICGVENDAALHTRVRSALDQAVAALLQSRPAPAEADAKTWMVLALRCARAAGAKIPADVVAQPLWPTAPPPATQATAATTTQLLLSSLLSYASGADAWPAREKRARDLWMGRQNPDGTFAVSQAKDDPASRIWSTAMAALDLALGDHFLPLDRR